MAHPDTHGTDPIARAARTCRRHWGPATGRVARAAALAWVLGGAAQAAVPPACEARSGPQQAVLVELYTSEGCNSCPPADKWLSSLRGRPGVLAAAFHVDYWDRLGWTDRFGSPRHTARQAELQASTGAGFSYTPQVLANGRDWRGWPGLPSAHAAAKVQLQMRRVDDQVVQVQALPMADAPARLGLWWAVLEDGHVSTVRAGENQGVTLKHDHVVRRYQREADWLVALSATASGAVQPQRWRLTVPVKGEGGRSARLLAVVVDATTQRPVQALVLDCAATGGAG